MFTFTEEQKITIRQKVESGEWNANTKELKDLQVALFRDDPLKFARYLFRHHFADQSTGEDMRSASFHQEVLDLLMDRSNRRLGIAAPRGHAKSTIVSFLYALHCIVYQTRKNIVLVSATEEMAIRFLRRIKDELESNNILRALYGSLASDKWSETEIRTTSGVSCHAKGQGAQLRGLIDGPNRPDLIICDDIEYEELVRSEIRRKDLEDWFNGTVLPTLEPKEGQLVLVGTILHQSSLLARVLDKTIYPDFTTRIYAAESEEGVMLWPEKMPKEQLDSIKTSYIARGQLAQFYMEYQNNPIAQEDAKFKPEYFQFVNADDIPKDVLTEIFVDVGGGSTKVSADDTALIVLQTDVHNTIFVRDYISDKMGTDTKRITDALFELNHKYHPSRIVIEKTVASNFLISPIESAMIEKSEYLNIEYKSPPRGSGDRRGNMSDAKFQRIAAMEAPFKFGAIKIQKWMTKLMDQLLSFPRGKHDDLIDALAYGYMFGERRAEALENDLAEELNHSYEPLYGDEIGL